MKLRKKNNTLTSNSVKSFHFISKNICLLTMNLVNISEWNSLSYSRSLKNAINFSLNGAWNSKNLICVFILKMGGLIIFIDCFYHFKFTSTKMASTVINSGMISKEWWFQWNTRTLSCKYKQWTYQIQPFFGTTYKIDCKTLNYTAMILGKKKTATSNGWHPLYSKYPETDSLIVLQE